MDSEISQQHYEPKALKFRQTKFWRIAVKIFFVHSYQFIWEYIMNFKGKILYIFSNIKKIPYDRSLQNGLKFIEGDKDFISIANKVKSNLSDLVLLEEKKKLLDIDDEGAFSVSLNHLLNEEIKVEILKFAISDNVLAHVYSYMKVVPKLTSFVVLYNIPRNASKEEGSKLWHRDSDLYKSLNIFICLSDVDENSGAYYAVDGSIIPSHAVIPKKYSMTESIWKRYRLSDEEFYQFAPKEKVVKLVGKPGVGVYVDPALCYHKGGFCKNNDRLMLQITFSTDDRVSKFDDFMTQYKINPRSVEDLLNNKEKRFIASSSQWKILRKLGFTKFIYYLNSNLFSYFMKPR